MPLPCLPLQVYLDCNDCDRSVWADFLTDDPTAWKVRIGEHYMFRDDLAQLDIDIERILFHPDRNREYPQTFFKILFLRVKTVLLTFVSNAELVLSMVCHFLLLHCFN